MASESAAGPSHAESQSLRDASRVVYGTMRLFHGTDQDGVASLRTNGFQADLKTAGGAAAEETSPEHFQTDSLDNALLYARARSIFTGSPPGVARTLGVPDLPDVERTQRRGAHWYVADDDIDKKHVLPSKNGVIDDATASLFQDFLAREGHEVSLDVARRELTAVQSDSEDDFRRSSGESSKS